ncbi:MAG: hypothetical protein CMJ40_09590 [Phycisphaerae bacterium]|nr:hypothetical protein [Phycisphaerae bacterium]
MIRSNLVTLLIILTLGWIVDGYAEAAKPTTPAASTDETIQQLLRIVGVDQEVRDEIALKPRVPMRKPTMLERSGTGENERLIIKFTDQTQMRMNAGGTPYSKSNQNIDSIAVILEELNLTLEPVFSGPEARITELINRAEKNSGQAQPDLAGIFYVEGNPQDIDGAAMILLHDPRVEWAGYRKSKFQKTVSDRIEDAIDTQMKQDPSMAIALGQGPKRTQSTVAQFDTTAPTFNDARPSTTRFGAMSDDTSDPMHFDQTGLDTRRTDGGNPEDMPQRLAPPACCVASQDLVDTAGGYGPFNTPGSSSPFVFNTCLELDQDTCDSVDGAFILAGDCADPLDPAFVVCENDAPGVAGSEDWSPLGACCTGGVQTFATRDDCQGEFMHDQFSRFQNGSYPTEPLVGGLAQNGRIPALNPALNVDLLSKTYGFENMVVPGGNVIAAQAEYDIAIAGLQPDFSVLSGNRILNSNYSYYAGSNALLDPTGNGPGGFPGVPASGQWVTAGFASSELPGDVPREPIFVNQNATAPYFPTNTGIVDAMYAVGSNGPGGAPLAVGYDPIGLYSDPRFVILWGQLDIVVDTVTGQAAPAILNGPGGGGLNPLGVSGGFTFYSLSPSSGTNVYNPNIYLAGPQEPGDYGICSYGVCAIDCYQPSINPPDQGCGPATAFAGFEIGDRFPVTESPIMGGIIDVPNSNVGCSSFVYEFYCRNALNGKTIVSDYNGTGALWGDLNQLPPPTPGIAVCQTINAPYGEAPAGWWKDYYVQDGGNECQFNGVPAYETFDPGEGPNALRGSCFFSNMNYPAMFTNTFSNFQLQAFGDRSELADNQFEWFYEPCYGGDNPDADYCPVSCFQNPNGTDDGLAAAVSTVAPLCADDSGCAGPFDPNNQTLTTAQIAGWSFLCADLANQFKLDPYSQDTNNPTYNTLDPNPPIPNVSSLVNRGNLSIRRYLDFDQTNQLAGPFTELNTLGLQPPYARNADGSIWDDPNIPGNDPTLIQPSLNCMINYGVQNQCFTTYFSQYQPSLGLAPNSSLPPFFQRQNGGCMDFQCCHTVCSIVYDPSTDDFNYGDCCDPQYGWTEECVEKAIELCYEREGGTQTRYTPNFVPLQFHLSQRSAAGPQPFRLWDQPMRRLAAAPTLPPTVISSIPAIPTFPADNWLQSPSMVQWVVSPRNDNGTAPIFQTWAAPSVIGSQSTAGVKYGLQIGPDPQTGELGPILNSQPNTPNSWQEFYYGEPLSSPLTFYESQGLSLYGTMDQSTWGATGPAGLSPTTGLYSWADFLLSLQPNNGPAGPGNSGAFGFGVNIAVLDTSAWIQEYTNAQGQLVGAIHEDLGNVLMEGPATGDEFVPMGFEPFTFEPQRGTAVLGTIAASQNGFGTDGIALQANTMFFPVMTSQGSVDREFNAWLSAMTHLKRGDILLATYPGGGGTDNIWIDGGGPTEGSILELLFGLSAALEISVILPVGDFGVQLGGLTTGGLDSLPSNVLNVGASMPSTLPKRAWSSNYIGVDDSGSIPMTTAITPITTTGGDCNLTRAAIQTQPDQPSDPAGYISRDMMSRSYTNDFGYAFDSSKAAAAQIAGVAACLQGISMQWYGASQPGANIALIINNNPRRLGGLFNGPAAPETTYDQAPLEGTGWQYGLGTPDGGLLTQYIGLMSDPARAAVDMVINPEWDVEAPADILTQAEFIRGYQLGGDYTSLQQPGDSNEMIGYSQFTYAFIPYEPDFFVPGAPFNYNASFDFGNEEAGEVTDLFIHGRSTNKDLFEENSLAFDIQMTLSPDPEEAPVPPTSLLAAPFSPLRQGFAYNYVTEQWDLMDNTVGFYPLFTFEPPSATDGRDYLGFEGAFDVRFVLTLPRDIFDDDGFLNEFVVFYDYVSLRVSGPIDP